MTSIERLHQDGFLRLGSKSSGFRYRAAAGSRPGAEDLRRFRSLGLPPAWRKVAIARSPGARLQAIGMDAAGRWQYRYHERATQEREEKKLQRLLKFSDALPGLRKRIDADLRQTGLKRDKLMACLTRILSLCFVRPGSRSYARENGSYGLCTLQKRHVRVRGDLIVFDFTGKSKQPQHRELRDRRVASVVRALLKTPGKQLFQWVTDDGLAVAVRRRDVNAYIKDVMGNRFSAKDFRTWSGTLLCACALARCNCPPDAAKATRKRLLAAAIKETAAHLGNTPSVCRASYVALAVQHSFEEGRTVSRYLKSADELATCSPAMARACEKSLVELLRAGSKPRKAAVKKGARPEWTRLGKVLVGELRAH